MVPSAYDIYFATVATAAAALIGLQFVAIAQRNEGTHLRQAADAGGERTEEQGATG